MHATIGGKLCVFDKIDIPDGVRIARDGSRSRAAGSVDENLMARAHRPRI
jgi:hypothetical protein